MNKKDVIRAEIERRRDFFYERYVKKGRGCIEESRYDECVEILSFIDSLPDCTVKVDGQGRVKDDVYDSLTDIQKPDKSLEEEYKDYVENDPVYSKLVNGIAGRGIAHHFYELGKNSK